MVTRFAALGAVGGGLFFTGDAIRRGVQFEESLSRIVGLVGVARDQVGEWRGELRALSAATGQGPQELAEAMFFVTSAGARGQEALDILEESSRAAAAGLGETRTVADLVTSAVNAYGSEVLSASAATDVLTAAVREGKAEPAELAASMGQVLPIASELGVTFDQVAAAQAAMTRTGTDARTAAIQLRQILNKIIRPPEQAKETLQEYGMTMEELRKQVGEEGLLPVLSRLREAFGDNQEAMSRVFPDVRALTGVLDIMGANVDNTRQIFDEVADSAGDAQKAFEETADTSRKLGRFTSSFKSLQLVIAEELNPAVGRMADEFAGVLTRVSDIIESQDDLSEGVRQALIFVREDEEVQELSRELGEMIGQGMLTGVQVALEAIPDRVKAIIGGIIGARFGLPGIAGGALIGASSDDIFNASLGGFQSPGDIDLSTATQEQRVAALERAMSPPSRQGGGGFLGIDDPAITQTALTIGGFEVLRRSGMRGLEALRGGGTTAARGATTAAAQSTTTSAAGRFASGFAGTALRLGSRAIPLASGLVSGGMTLATEDENEIGKAIGNAIGTAIGGAAGFVGTSFMGGVPGAVVGGVAGGEAGEEAGGFIEAQIRSMLGLDGAPSRPDRSIQLSVAEGVDKSKLIDSLREQFGDQTAELDAELEGVIDTIKDGNDIQLKLTEKFDALIRAGFGPEAFDQATASVLARTAGVQQGGPGRFSPRDLLLGDGPTPEQIERRLADAIPEDRQDIEVSIPGEDKTKTLLQELVDQAKSGVIELAAVREAGLDRETFVQTINTAVETDAQNERDIARDQQKEKEDTAIADRLAREAANLPPGLTTSGITAPLSMFGLERDEEGRVREIPPPNFTPSQPDLGGASVPPPSGSGVNVSVDLGGIGNISLSEGITINDLVEAMDDPAAQARLKRLIREWADEEARERSAGVKQ